MVLALLLAAAAASPAPATGAQVVEQVVAVVRNPAGAVPRAITLTKLVEESRVALVSRGAVEAAFLPLDAAALRAGLSWLVDQTLVADEAARLQVDEVGHEVVAAALRAFQGRFPDAAAYRRFLAASELGEEDVAAALARSIRVERYLETRVGPGARVADEEVERRVRAGGAAGAGSETERDQARAELERTRARAQVRELLHELRARADVRVLDPALRPAAGEGS